MKTNLSLIFCILIVLLVLSACSGAPAAVPVSVGTTTPVSVQVFDSALAKKMEAEIDKNYPNVYSILVQKSGSIVYEKYYQGHNEDTYTHVFSVTKSVTSALIGIALDKGLIQSLDQPLADFLPEYFTNPELMITADKKAITIRHALTMTAGLNPTDDTLTRWMEHPDWFAYTLEQPMEWKPGEKFAYDTGLTHLLSGVISKATGMTTKEFADKYLFGPLGITNYKWDTDTKGFYGGGHLLYLTPRDMAKFGQLYLQHGLWNGVQLVPEKWVSDSTSSQIQVDDVTSYGYLWWVYQQYDSLNKNAVPAYAARGYGSQHIIVIPERDLIVVITSNPNVQ